MCSIYIFGFKKTLPFWYQNEETFHYEHFDDGEWVNGQKEGHRVIDELF